jgi:hypothetical protein
MTAQRGLFAKYRHRVFIETGCYEGNGIQQALDEGYELVYSIELMPEYYNHCTHRFRDNPNVKVILGDSAVMLEPIMQLIDEPCTLWLDAHIGGESSPLIRELEILKAHPIKTHTILIDDLRMWKTRTVGFNPPNLISKCLEINPDYIIEFADGNRSAHKVLPRDILVAHV